MAALSLKADLFAALQALRDPVKFGSTLGRKNQGVDTLRQNLIGGIAEKALKFAVHALCAERRVDHQKSVGRIFKKLFEELAAKVERIAGVRRLEFGCNEFQASAAGWTAAETPGGMKEGEAPLSSAWRKFLARKISLDCAGRVTRPPIRGSPSEAQQSA